MSHRQQLERIIEIDRQIRGGLYPDADGLAQVLEVSRRVIFNDRAFLIERLGAPLRYSRSRKGWYYADETWVLPTALVTRAELFSFFLSIEIARRHLGTAFERELLAVVDKIGAGLTGSVAVDLESLRSCYTVAAPSAAATEEATLMALHDAIIRRRCVRIQYYTASRRASSERVVNPHHLHNVSGDWYLIAHDQAKNCLRTFHAGRIQNLVTLSEGFTPDPDFDALEWMRSSFRAERQDDSFAVAVRFEPEQAVYIRERRWHPNQQIEETPDGGLILRWHGSGLGEIRRWVMQYGAQAEVLEPAELRTTVIGEIARMAAKYDIRENPKEE